MMQQGGTRWKREDSLLHREAHREAILMAERPIVNQKGNIHEMYSGGRQ